MLALALAAVLALDPTSTPVTVEATPAPLHGTLLTPDGETRAAALILPGSGPTDRDGNSPMGITASTYRLLAEGLAAEGVATVRIDKRGIAQSGPAGYAEADMRFDHYVADARAWAIETARLTGRPCAWLIGHSEGALVALAAARDNAPSICGLILLSGAGRPAAVVIGEQLRSLPEPLNQQARLALDDLAHGHTTASIPGLETLFRPSVQPYLISWFALDPAELIVDFDRPMLIGQGETDIQTTVEDAETLHAANRNAKLVIWPGVNHVLKTAPADRAANVATYGAPALPLAPGVVEDVAAFILAPR